tara:strand:- start:213 stop:485 length:273 start_codon:yes stop_codon:yes gene_type:complete
MGRKGKTQKHTAAEIASKHKAAKHRAGAAGGGSEGAEKRKIAGGKISQQCEICKAILPSLKSMEIHYESKHSKINFNDVRQKYEELFNSK